MGTGGKRMHNVHKNPEDYTEHYNTPIPIFRTYYVTKDCKV